MRGASRRAAISRDTVAGLVAEACGEPDLVLLDAGGIGRLPSDVRGAYALLIRLAGPVEAALPGRAAITFMPGWYVYCGSARGSGGLRARLGRHLRREKALRWHVDRLTVAAADMVALPAPDGDECDLVRRLAASPRFAIAAPGFGSSDCRTCEGHLLRLEA